MTPEQFVHGLLVSVVDENAETYRQLFIDTQASSARDPYWQQALTLFGTLSPDQREVFFAILRQVCVDTTSNILGIIDNSSYVEGSSGDMSLLDEDGSTLNGDLQSLFLAEAENGSPGR